jgi:hypothetical protein
VSGEDRSTATSRNGVEGTRNEGVGGSSPPVGSPESACRSGNSAARPPARRWRVDAMRHGTGHDLPPAHERRSRSSPARPATATALSTTSHVPRGGWGSGPDCTSAQRPPRDRLAWEDPSCDRSPRRRCRTSTPRDLAAGVDPLAIQDAIELTPPRRVRQRADVDDLISEDTLTRRAPRGWRAGQVIADQGRGL